MPSQLPIGVSYSIIIAEILNLTIVSMTSTIWELDGTWCSLLAKRAAEILYSVHAQNSNIACMIIDYAHA